MANEHPLPDDLKNFVDKRGGKDRRKKGQGRLSDDEDGAVGEIRRPGQKDRRHQKNYKDLLNDDDD
jgi:hypothetical protein